MSVLNQSGEEQVECPLCMEPLEVDDLHFYPCTCGYQICRFCWNRIREGENGLCPACRKAYPENPADFIPLSQEQVAAIKTEKKAREQKRRNKTLESRRALANVRVVQNNLVFVVGLPVRLADPEILKRQEYFGKYGKIHKVVINQSTTYAGSQGPSASAYVTYVSSADALRAIQGVNNVTLDGRVLKGSLGTTKYCANFMKNQPCPKPDCMYLHDLGDPKASFTKEEMHAGLHQVYERKLHNQLLASQQRDKNNEDKQLNGSGNSSTNAEKSGSKDGNQSNYIPTTVVTSSHINNVVNSKSKEECANGSTSSSSSSSSRSDSSDSSSSSSGSSANGKEAWPSLGSSPPSDSPARKQTSPKPQQLHVKSQENGISGSSSPTELHTDTAQQQAQTRNVKETHTDTNRTRNKDTNGTSTHTKKSKNEKSKHKPSHSTDSGPADDAPRPHSSVFETDSQHNYISNDLDELESDRHSLLETHDLLESSDHSLLDDDTHDLLNDAGDALMMQRHRDMLAGLVDGGHLLPQLKGPVLNGYGLLDRDISYVNDRPISQMNQGLLDQKEMLLREREQSDMLLRQRELLARQHNVMVEPKHYMPASSIGMESASELLGANYHRSPSMVPAFGALPPYALPRPQVLHAPPAHAAHAALLNGFDAAHNSEGRYLAENMDKFFTDFHKAQQLRLHARAGDERRYQLPRNVLSAEALEMEHKQRMNNVRSGEPAGRAAGDGDDDLDFDPFKETQKAFAELMENEMMQNAVSGGDNARRSRLAPPGFSHVNNTYGAGGPRLHAAHQGYNTNSPMFSDWTQMDPAIMSTSVSGGSGLSQHQHDMFVRFNALGVTQAPPAPPAQPAPAWPPYVPLPPGFTPAQAARPRPEPIDAK
ncbi:uncharacterized protein LOC114239578 isoform X1 [Bombyx mandarina]|uniref:CCR4-NOT transcription complex subunit 4 n=1 Tax=Bombyx mandarina TaxID=7092 RepID=A0A6J2J8C6_BOMMA|nr:uncharacterized protein LOC114239578 isoform X1 [Bombyx mandarina]